MPHLSPTPLLILHLFLSSLAGGWRDVRVGPEAVLCGWYSPADPRAELLLCCFPWAEALGTAQEPGEDGQVENSEVFPTIAGTEKEAKKKE